MRYYGSYFGVKEESTIRLAFCPLRVVYIPVNQCEYSALVFKINFSDDDIRNIYEKIIPLDFYLPEKYTEFIDYTQFSGMLDLCNVIKAEIKNYETDHHLESICLSSALKALAVSIRNRLLTEGIEPGRFKLQCKGITKEFKMQNDISHESVPQTVLQIT